jgi:hypothetical protein
MVLKKLALKRVLQLDPYGKLIGDTLAQEHPYNEGEWMMPEYAIDVPPPKNMRDDFDYYYNRDTGYWEQRKKPIEKVEEDPSYQLSDLEKAKIYRNNILDNYTVIIDNMEFEADENSLQAIQQYVEYGEEDPVEWVLKNNQVRKVSKETLRKVLSKAVTFKTTQWSKAVTQEKEWAKLGQEVLEENK